MPKVLDEEAFDALIGPVCLIAELEPVDDWPDELRALVDAARHAKAAFRFHVETSAMDVTERAREFCAGAFGPLGVDIEPYVKIIAELISGTVTELEQENKRLREACRIAKVHAPAERRHPISRRQL